MQVARAVTALSLDLAFRTTVVFGEPISCLFLKLLTGKPYHKFRRGRADFFLALITEACLFPI